MRDLNGTEAEHGEGAWRVYLTPPGQYRTEVSVVRGITTEIGSIDDQDPFTWQQTELVFPALTIFDRPGHGELYWLSEGADVDIEWDGPVPAGYDYDGFAYEGFVEDFVYSKDGITVTVTGAMYQVDRIKAKPEHPVQPLPYEFAIRRIFEARPSLRVRPPVIEWPSWWTETYTPAPRRNTSFIPSAVRPNDRWTGMVTRSTGSWDDALTSYIQSLLGGMYTARGRWTLELDRHRRTVLRHREFQTAISDSTVVIDAASPMVDITLREDFSQTGNVWYGTGKSLQGVGYSGMEVSVDGARTRYRPLAAARQVEPEGDRSGWLQTEKIRREVVLQLQDGLDQAQAEAVGEFQHRRFGEPGLVGEVTLNGAVRLHNGEVLSHFLVRSGMSVWLSGVKGSGVFAHVVKVSRKLADNAVVLTVDTKYRDALTIDQMRVRGRDALAIPRLLIGGQYQPALADQLVPWSYAEGSGFIPSSPGYSSLRLFDGMPDDVQFPWTEWTTERPPKSRSWRSAYIGIGPKKASASDNWAYIPSRSGGRFGFPIRMAQAATIRMLQIAAYDMDGNVLPVPFHVSLYSSNGVNVDAMPKIPGPGPVDGYLAEQRYPFFQGAWERYGADGVEVGTEITVPVQSAGFIRGWGSGRVKAGYWPGSNGSHEPTGLLVDTEPFQIQTPTGDGSGDWGINPYSERQLATYAGYLYLMIYCDAQLDQSVFFVGRFFRDEPGGNQ